MVLLVQPNRDRILHLHQQAIRILNSPHHFSRIIRPYPALFDIYSIVYDDTTFRIVTPCDTITNYGSFYFSKWIWSQILVHCLQVRQEAREGRRQ